MQSLEQRVSCLESRSKRGLVAAAALGLVAGALLGGVQPTHLKRLVGTGLTIVDEAGHPIIDLAPDTSGAGRIHVRDASGVAEVVMSAGDRGGGLDLFDATGQRTARLGGSPSGDGMLLLTDAKGSPLVRLGRWTQGVRGSLWTAPLSEPSTP